MSYSYTPGQGVSALVPTEPNGATEPVSNLDDAIRQIKLFLTDTTAGWPSILTQSAALGTQLAALGTSGNRNFFAVYSSVNQSVPIGVYTKINFALEQADPDSVFDPTQSRFTAPATGWYRFNLSVRIDWLYTVPFTDLTLHLRLKKSDGTYPAAAEEDLGSNWSGITYTLTRTIYLTAGQYVEPYIYYSVLSGTMGMQLTADAARTAFQGIREL